MLILHSVYDTQCRKIVFMLKRKDLTKIHNLVGTTLTSIRHRAKQNHFCYTSIQAIGKTKLDYLCIIIKKD